MIYKQIKRQNGLVYLCPYQLESATERPPTAEQEIILELEQQKAELIEGLKDICNNSRDFIDVYNGINTLLKKYSGE